MQCIAKLQRDVVQTCYELLFIGLYYPKVDKTTLPVIVMEKMHSSLRGLVEEHADIPMNVTLSILNDVCLGLQYLHSRKSPIIHRNLTPNNILLCYHLKAKISDIGIVNGLHTTDTQAFSQDQSMNPFVPLKLTSKSVHDLSLDVFSFGGVILYIATHQWPQLTSFDVNTSGRIVLTELQQYQQYFDKMSEIYADLKPLVVLCLDDNPEKHPSVAQVLMEIKTVKNSYSDKLCSSLWEGKHEQQSLTAQFHKQTEQQQWEQDKRNRQQHLEPKHHEEEWQKETEEQKYQKKHQLDTQQPQLLKASCISYI